MQTVVTGPVVPGLIGGSLERFVIITGLSGAGKTTALHALEELGYFTVDNLPPGLWPMLVTQCEARAISQVAVSTDARTREFLADLEPSLARLNDIVRPEIAYLEAEDEILIRRYGLTRRTHPLHEPTLVGDLRQERHVLGALRMLASVVIDTTELSARALVERIGSLFGRGEGPILRLYSFGFKHGAPRDADLVLDVRGLPNPYYVPELSPLSGLEPAVRDYVFSAEAVSFYHELREFLVSNLELVARSSRNSYTVAIGCTGGRHRSVAVVEALARDLNAGWRISVEHRDLDKGDGGP